MNEKQSFDDAVLKTVMFWSDKSFRTPMNQNNGDDSPGGAMGFMIMNESSMLAQKEITNEQMTLFERCLGELILAERGLHPTRDIYLSVDYAPCHELAVAAQTAGINNFACFPCKTSTWIGVDNVAKAAYQYHGKPYVL